MSQYSRVSNWQSWMRVLGGVFTIVCLLLLIAHSTSAQFPSLAEASVVIDGRPLFEIAQTEQINADERAEYINQELKERVKSGENLLVATEIRNQAPVLLVNGRYLMTVTQEDAKLNDKESAGSQALAWTSLLNRELDFAQQERSREVLRQRVIVTIGALILAISVHYLSGALWRRLLRPFLEHLTALQDDEHSPPIGLNLLFALLVTVFRFGLWFGVITYITNLFPFTRHWSYFLRRQALAGFLEPNLRLGQSEFSILSLVILLGFVLGVVVISGIFTNFLRSRVLRLAGINRGSQEAISVLVKYGFIFIGGVVLLQIWGLDLSSLALIASALGVGVGLGLQNIAKDFGSGLILVFERPIQVGDFVEFGQFQGTVEHIGARSTEIKTLDQISLIVPNSRFLEQEVINWSHRNSVSRIHLPVGVAYSAEPEVVREILIEVSYECPQVLSVPPPMVFFQGFGENALKFELLVWITNPPKQLMIKSNLYFAISAALRKNGIEIPFPQRDLHIRSGPLSLESSTDALNRMKQQ